MIRSNPFLSGSLHSFLVLFTVFYCFSLMFPVLIYSQEEQSNPPPEEMATPVVEDNEDSAEIPAETIYQKLDREYGECNILQKRENALNDLRALLKEQPDDYELLWRAARLIWFIGDWLEEDQGEKLERLGIEGMKYADAAIKLKPDGIEGKYYKALSISTYSRGISIIKALMKGLASDYVENLEFVIDQDPEFDRGGPLRAMGRYYWKLPWPKYDYKKSLSYLDKAMKVNDKVLRTYFYRADTLWALKKYNEARKSFEYVINTDPEPFDYKDVPWVKQQAQKRLNQLIIEEF